MMEKYKINTAAADFKMTAKALAAVISAHTGTEKKSGATLTEQEVNILFDALTKEHEVKSFDAYFETGKAAREAQEKEKKAAKDKKLADQMAILEQLKAAQEAEMAAKKAEKEKTEKAKAEPMKTVASKAEEKKTAEPKKEEPKKEHKPSDPKPFEARKKEDRPAGAAPNRGPAERRTVDTRFSNVDIEKYNEKYENIAPANSMRDNTQRK
ncbi:MAG: hypothetical protein J6Q67_00720, partial [Clostridia bacterium]|nr:hypothetical protein [Clostridia bacterium]